MINKEVKNAKDAIQDIFDGATIMLGGFGLCGIQKLYYCSCSKM